MTDTEEHPEAHGFGQARHRLRWELALVVLVIVGVPLLLLGASQSVARLIAKRIPESVDATLGAPTWKALQVSSSRCSSSAAQTYIEGLAMPLVAELKSPFEFQFMVVDSPEVNAFALPGGYVVVNSGLIEKAESGEEIAAVLAHELHHVTLRHGTSRVLGQLGTAAALTLFFGGTDLHVPAYTLTEFASLSHDRAQEQDADAGGIALLKKVGISPKALATFFRRLKDAPLPPALLSTHPDPGDRAAQADAAAVGFTPTKTLPSPKNIICSG